MRVLVLCGGATSERIVSLASGDAVAGWVAGLGHDVLKYDPEHVGKVYPSTHKMAPEAIGLDAPAFESSGDFHPHVVRGLLDTIEREKIDLVFPILHGGYGEDGTLQSLLEWVGISYTGSGPLASAVAMHKATAKSLMLQAGIPLAQGFEIPVSELRSPEIVESLIESSLGFPVVVKPMNGGSTIGLSIVRSSSELPAALNQIISQNDGALVEQYFKGREIAATVVNGVALPLVEIRPKDGFYDYSNKYTSGRTEYVCPAELPLDIAEAIRECAEDVFVAVGARGFARVDFLVSEEMFICLELNSLPGMTTTSLVPKAARAYGWSPEQLIEKIIETAWSPVKSVIA
ncbi:MAG: D-alanine--D-alanine ligase [Calditrichaeota bacterium]|nr:D-alanine--D-alanine ligase [Calditrichota bacterium]MCB9368446.1 D-alanine--D-alanine ligase [Calditrichota bacterium]